MPVSADGILEATFDPTWAAVRLIVDGGMWPDPVDAITVTRSTPSTPTTALRGLENRSVVGGSYVGSDHEMDMPSTITYVVTGYASGVEGASTSVAVSTAGAADGLWLKVAGQPDLTVRCPIKDIGAIASPTIGGVYQIAGGGGSVAQTLAQWSGIESDRCPLTVATSVSDRARLRAALAKSRVVLLQPIGTSDLDAGWYLVCRYDRSNIAQVESFEQRHFELDVQRTGVPAGEGTGIAGTTWSTLQDGYATWDDVLAAFASWFDVLKGTPS